MVDNAPVPESDELGALRAVLSVVDNCCQCVIYSEEHGEYVSIRDGAVVPGVAAALRTATDPA